jgi:hypothetical protein
MKLSPRQIESLQRSARQPGRQPAADRDPETERVAAADRDPETERVTRALEDVRWAIGKAIAPAPGRRPERAPPPAASSERVTEWQPIATAPQERNLEVRVNDRIGRYRVLYPCRLVPGTGWINVVVKRKLTMEPVEWRDWPEDRPDFG